MLSFLVDAFAAPEEECNCTGTCMAADRRADAVDEDFAVELWEFLFNERSNCLCILKSSGVRNEAFSVVIEAVFGELFHFVYDLGDDFCLAADLETGNELAVKVDIKERTDL